MTRTSTVVSSPEDSPPMFIKSIMTLRDEDYGKKTSKMNKGSESHFTKNNNNKRSMPKEMSKSNIKKVTSKNKVKRSQSLPAEDNTKTKKIKKSKESSPRSSKSSK